MTLATTTATTATAPTGAQFQHADKEERRGQRQIDGAQNDHGRHSRIFSRRPSLLQLTDDHIIFT